MAHRMAHSTRCWGSLARADRLRRAPRPSLVVVHVRLGYLTERPEPLRLAPVLGLPLGGAIHRLAVSRDGELIRAKLAPVNLYLGSVGLVVQNPAGRPRSQQRQASQRKRPVDVLKHREAAHTGCRRRGEHALPMRVRREVIADEVVVGIGAELDRERATWVLEVPHRVKEHHLRL